jgi:hypothetical protein
MDREYSIADAPPGLLVVASARLLTLRHRTDILARSAQVFVFLASTQDVSHMTTRTSRNRQTLTDLQTRQAELVRRLQDGDAQILSARQSGVDTVRWEDHWIMLLRQYESVCREISQAERDQYPVAA